MTAPPPLRAKAVKAEAARRGWKLHDTTSSKDGTTCTITDLPGGKMQVDLDLPPAAHKALVDAAKRAGVTVEQLVVDLLATEGESTPALTIPAEAQATLREVAAVLAIDPQELVDLYVAQSIAELGDPESGMLLDLIRDPGTDPAVMERFRQWCTAKGLRHDRFKADIDDALAERQAA